MSKQNKVDRVFPFKPKEDETLQEKYRSSVMPEPSMIGVNLSIVISIIVIGLATWLF